MMETLEVLKNRISTNKFDTTRKLSDDEIRDLIRWAGEAPSAYNVQPWRFIAVTRQEDKERLKAVAYGQQKVSDAAVTFIVLGDLRGYERLPDILKRSVEAGIFGQPMADNWSQQMKGAHQANAQAARDEAIRGASLAAMALMVAAGDKGLATGPMIGFDPEGVKKEFSIPDRYVPAMLITAGYPAPGNWPRKPRLAVDEILSFGSGKDLEP
jgi:nitroreductase